MTKTRPSDRIDTAIAWLKWPAAVAAVLLLPGACRSMVLLGQTILASPQPLGPFVIGLMAYGLTWWTLLRRPFVGSYFSTLEHELTHALFAVATGHRVVGLKATWKRGGRITFRGRGNWLITLSPYFFPTTCIAVLLLGLMVPANGRFWIDALLGAAFGYHLVSTWEETHLGQSDLKKAGYVFSLLFLPTANLIVVGVLLSFAYGGVRGVVEFVHSLSRAWW